MTEPTPLDLLVADPSECHCEPSPWTDEDDADEPPTHYYRECSACGERWYSLHCPHDGAQSTCGCGTRARQVREL